MDGQYFSVKLEEYAEIHLLSPCLKGTAFSQSCSGKMLNDTCYTSLAITGVIYTTTETSSTRHSVDLTFLVFCCAPRWAPISTMSKSDTEPSSKVSKISSKVFLQKAYQAKLLPCLKVGDDQTHIIITKYVNKSLVAGFNERKLILMEYLSSG